MVVDKKEKEKEPKKKDISQMSKKERKEFKQKVLCNYYSLIPLVDLYVCMYVCMYVRSIFHLSSFNRLVIGYMYVCM